MKSKVTLTKEKKEDLKALIQGVDRHELRRLLQSIDVDAVLNEKGQTALMIAAQGPSVARLEEVLEAGAQVDQVDYFGCSALFYAAECGHYRHVMLLLKHGATIDLRDNDGETALMKASLAGSEDVVKLLIRQGARVNARSGFDGTTPLMNAARGSHLPILRYLINRGALRTVKDFLGHSAFDWLREAVKSDRCFGQGLAYG